MTLAITQQPTNVPEGTTIVGEDGQETQLTAEQQKYVEIGSKVLNTGAASGNTEHTKPEGIPDKFWDPATGQVNYEALAKSYVELEAKLGGKKPEDTTTQTEQKPGADGEQKTPEQQQQEQDNVFVKASKEFTEKGAITEDTYKVLAEKHNIPKEYVDAYVEGQVAKQQLQQQTSSQKEEQLLGSVGGREAFEAMASWAKQTFSEAELDAFNAQVALSAESAALALQFLKTRYVQSNGKEAKLITGGRPTTQVVDGFTSKTEMMAAMRDPRYGKDQAFTAEVARKMANRHFAI